jgi:hypothetical protein
MDMKTQKIILIFLIHVGVEGKGEIIIKKKMK